MSHRYVSGVLQNDWNDPVDFHLIDRSEDVVFELVWVIKHKTVTMSFPVYITKKKVKSVINSAVLHWPTWLMVLPRNAGFGRCYLVFKIFIVLFSAFQSTHQRKFGIHVTVHRPPERPSVRTAGIPMLNCSINRYGNPNITRGYFGGKSHSHRRLV